MDSILRATRVRRIECEHERTVKNSTYALFGEIIHSFQITRRKGAVKRDVALLVMKRKTEGLTVYASCQRAEY